PGLPTATMSAIRFFSMTMSTGPTGGEPVPSIRVTPRRMSRANGPSPSVRGGALGIDGSVGWPASGTAKTPRVNVNQAAANAHARRYRACGLSITVKVSLGTGRPGRAPPILPKAAPRGKREPSPSRPHPLDPPLPSHTHPPGEGDATTQRPGLSGFSVLGGGAPSPGWGVCDGRGGQGVRSQAAPTTVALTKSWEGMGEGAR